MQVWIAAVRSGSVSGGGWVFLAILLLCVSGAGIGALALRRKIRDFSRQVFGTDSLADGLNRQADILAATPKSVTGMTKLMEPQIMRDFPDFSWEQFKAKAENMLRSALYAISSENEGALAADASDELRQQIANRIAENRAAGVKETYREIEIHQTEIANYKHEKGKCVIVIQSAVGCYHYRECGQKVIRGSRERKEQTRYNIELVYIQDASGFVFDNAYGTLCPHCGAPIKSVGNMVCEYCGSAVTPVNIKVWSLHKFYEVDYNHN
jgi:hypothetical protein